MDWMENVTKRLKRKNKILFSKDNELQQNLNALIHKQSHRTLVLWALDLAEESAAELEEKYPNDHRPRNALEKSRLWSQGKIKMPEAKRAILDCHAMAKELTKPEDIALCHAIGQACGVVHTPRHALGYSMYELTSLVRKHGLKNCKIAIESRYQQYVDKLLYWSKHRDENEIWAAFIKD